MNKTEIVEKVIEVLEANVPLIQTDEIVRNDCKKIISRFVTKYSKEIDEDRFFNWLPKQITLEARNPAAYLYVLLNKNSSIFQIMSDAYVLNNRPWEGSESKTKVDMESIYRRFEKANIEYRYWHRDKNDNSVMFIELTFDYILYRQLMSLEKLKCLTEDIINYLVKRKSKPKSKDFATLLRKSNCLKELGIPFDTIDEITMKETQEFYEMISDFKTKGAKTITNHEKP